jgi:raffinose/stachyose/melibiose transport system permease protein
MACAVASLLRRRRARLAAALGESAVRIEHVGSTALPGIPAKPVIDVQVSVRDMADEAAYVDGAGAWNTFFRVTLPLLVPVVGTVTVLTFIGNYNVFGLVWAMGGVEGGPAGSTDVLGLLFYRTAFRGGVDAFGVASALAVIMFVFILGISLLFQRGFRRLEERLS